jgi:hypothetical protein
MAKERNSAGSRGAILVEAVIGLPVVLFVLFATYYVIVRPFLAKQDLLEVGSNAILYAFDGPSPHYIMDLRDQTRALALAENIKLDDNATAICPQSNLTCSCTFSYLDTVTAGGPDTLNCLSPNVQTYFHITLVNDQKTIAGILGYKKF